MKITVPVRLGDFSGPIIGELTVFRDQLPPTAEWCLALAVEASTQFKVGEIPTAPITGPCELREVAIVHDDVYLAYLRQIGK